MTANTRYEMHVGLEVADQAGYAQYRREMKPLLDEAGGRFRYDFEVTRLLQHESDALLNRVFVLQFPSVSHKERFFNDPRYVEIKRRLFDPAVKTRVNIAAYTTDDSGASPTR